MLYLNIIKVKTPEEMGKAAADEFEAVICRKPACVMGLATGSTPLPLYRELIAREQAGKLDFSRVRSANLDEYKGLAPDHPQSYRRFMQETCLTISPSNLRTLSFLTALLTISPPCAGRMSARLKTGAA